MENKRNASRKPKGRPTQAKNKIRLVKSQDAPKFIYTSDCCKVIATKKACVKDVDKEFKDRDSHLGSWRCSQCKRKCKVTRSLNSEGLKLEHN